MNVLHPSIIAADIKAQVTEPTVRNGINSDMFMPKILDHTNPAHIEKNNCCTTIHERPRYDRLNLLFRSCFAKK
jgi:hypothetical protein